MTTKIQAIQSLIPGAEVSVAESDGHVTWINPPVALITEEQIQREQQRLEIAYKWYEYQNNRVQEYPSIQEQLDSLYHAGVFPSDMTERIRAVKQKYPPPNMSFDQWVISNSAPEKLVVEIPLDLATKLPPVQLPARPRTTMSVEEWLAEQNKVEVLRISRAEWLAKIQAQTATMTREEWLAQQNDLGQ